MHEIDIETWKRKSHYLLFGGYTNPTYVMDVRLDMTCFMEHRSVEDGFFIPFTWLLMMAANQFEGFRIRWVDGRLVCFDAVHPSYTVLLEDQNFAFQATDYCPSYRTFAQTMHRDIADVRAGAVSGQEGSYFETNSRAELIYISSMPWVDFRSISNPLPYEDKMSMSIPRFNWGKCVREGDRWAMSLSVTVNHAYIDGYEVSMMLLKLQELLDNCQDYF